MFVELKKILKICLCIFLLYLCVFYWSPFIEFIKLVISAASPLILGICVAFIVNILMSCYERWVFPSKKSGFVAKIRRPLCMVGAFATAILVLALAIWLVVPQLSDCIQIIISFLMQIPQYMKEFIVKAQDWDFIPRSVLDYLAGIDWESRITALVSWLSSGVGDVVNTLAKTIMSIVSGVITTIIGLIFSIYLLLDKDNLKRQFKKLFENYLPEKTCGKLFYIFRIFKDSFKKFIVGQLTEAVILGVLCILGMLIFGLPYATMIGTLVGFTALIPIAGAYIGAATGALMILTVSPAKALGFLILYLFFSSLRVT